MAERLEAAVHKDDAHPAQSAHIDARELLRELDTKTPQPIAPQKTESKSGVTPVKAAEVHGGLYGAGVIAGLEREGVLFKRTVVDNGISGIGQAIKEQWEDKKGLADKAVGGAVMGSAMRLLLPKEGVAKAIAGTAMVGYFLVDAAKPIISGVGAAWNAHDDKSLDKASVDLSNNIGHFTVDTAIGMASGLTAAKGTSILLESKSATISELPGVSKLRQFDGWKNEQLTSNEKPVGKLLNKTADHIDEYFDRVQKDWNPFRGVLKPAIDLSTAEKLARIVDTEHKVFGKIVDDKFFEEGPSSEVGMAGLKFKQIYNESPDGTNFSDYVDSLISKKPSGSEFGSVRARQNIHTEINTDIQAEVHNPPLSVPDESVKTPVDASPTVPDTVPGVELSSVLGKQRDAISGRNPNPSKPPSMTAPKLDLDPLVIGKVADVAKASQAEWSKDKVLYADYRDTVQGPNLGVADKTRVGSMLRTEYDHSSKQISDLASQVDGADSLRQAGMLLNLHTRAVLQVLSKRPDSIDYNNFADELHGFFREGMRRAGVSETVLSGKVPSLTAVTDDQGSGYFTIPNVDNVIDRPVTVVPRSMTGLRSVFTGVLRHENLGHDDTFPTMARFPGNIRDDVIGSAVDNAMKAKAVDESPITVSKLTDAMRRMWSADEVDATGKPKIKSVADGTIEAAMADNEIPDTKIKLGAETISKSEFFKRLLYAEANENTADFMGTASGGIDTPVSLGVLLQSLRKGGFLETRNVYGAQFEEGIEPHGIDRWRVKFCAEVMRQLAPKDGTVNEYADALDDYAQKASRPGETSYIWASVDNPGETINIPMNEWDAVIPHIVKAQLDTPLDALKTEKFVQAQLKDPNLEPGDGDLKTLRDVIWGHDTTVRNIDNLANQMVDAVHQGKFTLDKPFDNKEFTIGQVFSAGLVAWLRATRQGEDPRSALVLIDGISDKLRATYRENNPHLAVLTPNVSTVMKIDTIKGVNVAARQAVSSFAGQNRNIRNWTERNSSWLAGPTGVNLTGDLMDVDKKQKELLGN